MLTKTKWILHKNRSLSNKCSLTSTGERIQYWALIAQCVCWMCLLMSFFKSNILSNFYALSDKKCMQLKMQKTYIAILHFHYLLFLSQITHFSLGTFQIYHKYILTEVLCIYKTSLVWYNLFELTVIHVASSTSTQYIVESEIVGNFYTHLEQDTNTHWVNFCSK